jgi:APA family basic amino acid/polyamine antiporter
VRTASETRTELVKGLGPVSATAIVMGSMIGSGIFIVSADIARQVGSPGMLLVVWGLAAFMTLVGALSYGELAAAMPHAGGQYVYLRESLGPLSGFLYGWTLFLVIQTGTVAAVAVGFAKFAGVFVPAISSARLFSLGSFNVSSQQLVAIGCLILLTVINCMGLRLGALVQNLFTFAKTAALLGLIVLGYVYGRNATAAAANFSGHFWSGASFSFHTLYLVGAAMVGALFASDAWNNITFTAGEVKNPQRDVPLSLILGAGTVLALYLAANVVYLNVLPLQGTKDGATPLDRGIQYASEDRVGTAAAQMILGDKAELVMAAFIIISTFGCANGLILAGARVHYAMARDGLFFPFAAWLHPETHAPVASLILQCVWACLLTLTGSYNDLLDYVIFAVVLFYILTITGLFVLRKTRPAMVRTYRAFGYPVLPALYIILALLIDGALLVAKPVYAGVGLFIVLLGVPVYFLMRKVLRWDGV